MVFQDLFQLGSDRVVAFVAFLFRSGVDRHDEGVADFREAAPFVHLIPCTNTVVGKSQLMVSRIQRYTQARAPVGNRGRLAVDPQVH